MTTSLVTYLYVMTQKSSNMAQEIIKKIVNIIIKQNGSSILSMSLPQFCDKMALVASSVHVQLNAKQQNEVVYQTLNKIKK